MSKFHLTQKFCTLSNKKTASTFWFILFLYVLHFAFYSIYHCLTLQIIFILIMLFHSNNTLQSSNTRSHSFGWLRSSKCSALNKYKWKHWCLRENFDENKRIKTSSQINLRILSCFGVSKTWKNFHDTGPTTELLDTTAGFPFERPCSNVLHVGSSRVFEAYYVETLKNFLPNWPAV